MQSHHGDFTTAFRAGSVGVPGQGFQVLKVGQGEENINLKEHRVGEAQRVDTASEPQRLPSIPG